MTAKSNKERQLTKYAKKREAGLKPLQLWSYEEHHPLIKAYDLALKMDKEDKESKGKK